MLVKKLRTSMGEEGITRAGQVLNVTARRGAQLIEKNLARALEPGEGNGKLSMPKPAPERPRRPGQKAPEVPLAPAATGIPTGQEPSPSVSPADQAPPSQDSTAPEKPKRWGRRKSSASTEVGS